MTRYLLDTNIPSEEMRSWPDPRVGEWMYVQPESSLFLSVVTLGELRQGIDLLAAGRRRAELERWFGIDLVPRFSARTLPVTSAVALLWGQLTARRQRSGAPLATADGLITATALEHRLTLVTRNERDFSGLGLDLLNPWN